MNLVEQIKQRKPIAPFVATKNGGLKQSRGSRFLVGKCPFCMKERRFWVDPERGLCGCHVPKCQAAAPGGLPMDVINFYSRINKLSNLAAIKELAQELGLWQESASHVHTYRR